jgi:hypothetical protein
MIDLLTEYEREEISRRVRDGAVMLDKRGPQSWAPMLHRRRDILDVGSIDDCPLGIVYGGYVEGLVALRIMGRNAALLGFNIVSGDDALDGGVQHNRAWDEAVFGAMTAAWRREAAQRVAAVAT